MRWTAGHVAGSGPARWSAGASATGSQPEPFFIQDARGTAAPDWLTLWPGPLLLQLVTDGYAWATGDFETLLPWAGAGVGWMVPLIWTVCFIGAACMLGSALVARFLVRRVCRVDVSNRAAR